MLSANRSKNFCQLAGLSIVPYIKISGPVKLNTQYGDPNSEVYDKDDNNSPIYGEANNPVRHFYPGAQVCYASPSLYMFNNKAYLSNQFDPSYGFFADSAFPTTGADGFYFYLITAGIDASTATWNVSTTDTTAGTGKITATVTPSAAPDGLIAYNPGNMVLVTLHGPVYDLNEGAPKANLPVTIKIEAVDNGKTVNYEFTLKKWFLKYSRSTNTEMITWCKALGGTSSAPFYNAPLQSDLTNGSSYFRRAVGGALLAEWGRLDKYKTALTWYNDAFYNFGTRSRTSAGDVLVLGSSGKVFTLTSAGHYKTCVSQ